MAFIRYSEPQAIAFGYAATCGVTANKTNYMAWKCFKQEYWLLIFHNHNVLYIQREQFTSYLNSLACLMSFFFKENKQKTPLDILVILLTLLALGCCTCSSSFQMTVRSSRWLRAECFTCKLTLECHGKGMERGWKSSTIRKKKASESSPPEMVTVHFVMQAQDVFSHRQQGNRCFPEETRSLLTHTTPHNNHNDFSGMISAKYEEM